LRYKIKWFLQKLFRGYSDPEAWDFQWYAAQYALPRLRKLKEIRHGFPAMLCEEGKTEEESDREWGNILGKMIRAFELILAYDFDCVNNPEIDEGTALFGKYFTALWD